MEYDCLKKFIKNPQTVEELRDYFVGYRLSALKSAAQQIATVYKSQSTLLEDHRAEAQKAFLYPQIRGDFATTWDDSARRTGLRETA